MKLFQHEKPVNTYVIDFQSWIEEFLNVVVLNGMIKESHDTEHPKQHRQEDDKPRETVNLGDAGIKGKD